MPDTSPSTALTQLAIPDALRRQLLGEQMANVGGTLDLPVVKIVPQGVGQFELADGSTVPTLTAVIIHHHPRFVLWDQAPTGGGRTADVPNRPACVSPDGDLGHPRPGFAHVMLQAPADGTEAIGCAACRYNQFDTAPMVGRQGRGKACNNQQAVFLMLQGQDVPVELTLPPTSLNVWREYILALSSRRLPHQAVLSTLTLERKERGMLRWSELKIVEDGLLDTDTFHRMLAKRDEFASALGYAGSTPRPLASPTPSAPVRATAVPLDETPFPADESGDDALPF